MDGCSTQDIVLFIVWNPPSPQVRWVMTTVREKRINALWYAWSHSLTSKNIMSQGGECLCTRLHGDGWGFISVYGRKALSKCEKYVNVARNLHKWERCFWFTASASSSLPMSHHTLDSHGDRYKSHSAFGLPWQPDELLQWHLWAPNLQMTANPPDGLMWTEWLSKTHQKLK